MSWNNALPYWVMELEHEHFLASSTCCFYDEWFSGISQSMPKHVTMQILQRRKEPEEQQKVYRELYRV